MKRITTTPEAWNAFIEDFLGDEYFKADNIPSPVFIFEDGHISQGMLDLQYASPDFDFWWMLNGLKKYDDVELEDGF